MKHRDLDPLVVVTYNCAHFKYSLVCENKLHFKLRESNVKKVGAGGGERGGDDFSGETIHTGADNGPRPHILITLSIRYTLYINIIILLLPSPPTITQQQQQQLPVYYISLWYE